MTSASAPQQRSAGKGRHIPQRTCVGCRKVRPKRELLRIVRTPEGSVAIDRTGKQSGRGSYVCPDQQCWEAALKRERLDRSLHTKVSVEQRKELAAQAIESLPG